MPCQRAQSKAPRASTSVVQINAVIFGVRRERFRRRGVPGLRWCGRTARSQSEKTDQSRAVDHRVAHSLDPLTLNVEMRRLQALLTDNTIHPVSPQPHAKHTDLTVWPRPMR